ncbi:MAG: GNAT family N-acetyltransferase [Nanoarchaeota archaeon]
MASKLEYKIENLGHHHGQSDMELGLYIDGEIIGVVQYVLFDGELTVSDILVRPEFRRQGFGSRMMKYIKQAHPEYKYVPSMKTDLGAKFVHKDIDIDEVRKIVREVLKSESTQKIDISDVVRLLTKKYNDEYGVSCDLINQGDCENFAEELHEMLKEMGIESEILSDGLFFDPFGDLEDDMMWDVASYGNKPENFKEVGLPSHYWIYVDGKHYDSDAPEGVNDMFELPIVKNFYLNKTKIKNEGKEVEGIDNMTKLSIFDFDKTLVNTPEPEVGMPEWEQKTGQKWKGSWWENPNSLDTRIFDMSVNPSVISAYKKERSNPNTLVVMMTGRKGVVKKEVEKILSLKGLRFDDHLFNDGGETLDFKIREIQKAIRYSPNIREVEMWDDRTAHIPVFQKLGNELVEKGYLDSFIVNHVKGGNLEESLLKESKLDSKKIKNVIRTDYALLDILDSTEASGSDWAAGGCWILADALSEYYGAPLYVVYNNEMNRIEHFMIKIGNMYMDSDGLRGGSQVIKTMQEEGVYVKDINNLMILPYSSDMNNDVIVRDIAASKKLVDLFKSAEKNELSESLVKEFLTQDEVALKQYLSMSDDNKKLYLPHEFSYFFNDFLEEEGIEFTMPKHMVPSNYADEPEVEEDMFDSEIELITWLENNNKELYNAFAEYLFKKIKDNTLPIPESEYPAWSYFDNSPELVKNQWLIHFTNNADDIAREGFKFGVDDMTKLGLTTNLGEFDKKYGGYNFAYLLSDFPKYSRRSYTQGGGHKYGKEAVVFNASGIKLWHHGDEEPQVIFYGKTASNIIPITRGENAEWAIRGKDGRVLFENDELQRVVQWLVSNYSQYRKQLNESMKTEAFDDDYKKWKRKNVTIRGVREAGQENDAGASLGRGLYTAFLSNKELAKKYGKVYFVLGGIPKNPLVFNTTNQWEIWFQGNILLPISKAKGKNYPDLRDFNEVSTIEDELQKLGYDGIVIKGREIVNFTPEDVKYFPTEGELFNYYNNSVRIREVVGEIIRGLNNEASIGPGGELIDFDKRFTYPYEEIWNQIKHYVIDNEKRWKQFGWIISDADYPSDKYKSYNEHGTFLKVEKIDDFAGGWDLPILDILNSDEDAYERAKKEGFIVDENGIVIGFNGVNFVDQVNEDIELQDDSDEEDVWDRVRIIARNKSGEEVGYAILDMTMLPEYEFDKSDNGQYSDEEIEKHFPDEYSVAKLEHLEVRPEFRKTGYARELMDAAVKYVRERGYKTMYLLASPVGVNKIDLDDLTDFYKKYGFEIIKDFGNSRDMVSQMEE